jgi:hypothetical protein
VGIHGEYAVRSEGDRHAFGTGVAQRMGGAERVGYVRGLNDLADIGFEPGRAGGRGLDQG